ncbi:MAG: Holliday junction branch migration protein RuvA [Patescibacteria group bacterium]
MIRSLRGTVRKSDIPFVTLEVAGVGYEIQCTLPLWEVLLEGADAQLHTYTFVREDRLELFGFPSESDRRLFCHFLNVPGIGPRTALQLCGVPQGHLVRAVESQDARMLSALKGIGKKMAEKLLVELQSLAEKGILRSSAEAGSSLAIDADALEALRSLGYDERTVLARLRDVPKDVKTTEGRVKHVLQTL